MRSDGRNVFGGRVPCSRQIRDPEYAGVVNAVAQAPSTPPQATVPPVAPPLAGPQPVEVYIGYALAQNPDIQAARKRVEAAANRVPQAASLQDPMLGRDGLSVLPVQTAAGQQQRSMNAQPAGSLVRQARCAGPAWPRRKPRWPARQLAAAELEVIEQVKRAYYELYYIQKAIRITEDDRKLLAT